MPKHTYARVLPLPGEHKGLIVSLWTDYDHYEEMVENVECDAFVDDDKTIGCNLAKEYKRGDIITLGY